MKPAWPAVTGQQREVGTEIAAEWTGGVAEQLSHPCGRGGRGETDV
jgi:hypothetical protein